MEKVKTTVVKESVVITKEEFMETTAETIGEFSHDFGKNFEDKENAFIMTILLNSFASKLTTNIFDKEGEEA